MYRIRIRLDLLLLGFLDPDPFQFLTDPDPLCYFQILHYEEFHMYISPFGHQQYVFALMRTYSQLCGLKSLGDRKVPDPESLDMDPRIKDPEP
jgi:hypothetical protein